MAVLELKHNVLKINNFKPCIRIDIKNPNNRKEFISLSKAADSIVNTTTNVRNCCDKNKGLKNPIYRVKDWYFIYK